MRDATGFRGWIALLDRTSGESIGITFWTDEDALRDEVASGTGLRDEIARYRRGVEAVDAARTRCSRSSRSTCED